MASTAQNVNSEREAYIQVKMNEYRRREASLRGRKINYFNDQTKKNEEWWGSCRLYTMVAVFALVMIAAIAIAIVAGLGLLI
jgi:hypothetical protein